MIAKIIEEFDRRFKELEQLSKYYFILGVVSDLPQRKDKKNITNAELLFVHEFGSPIKGIPSRPILDISIKECQDLVDESFFKCVQLILDQKIDRVEIELERTALRIESFIRKMIYENKGGLQSLKQQTITQKGSDIPLLDTGQLARSIVCLVQQK